MTELIHNLVIDSRTEEIKEVRRWVTHHTQQTGFDADSIFAIELATAEAVANVIEHAYENQPGHEIRITLSIDAVTLKIAIRDFGKKFDQATYKPPQLDAPQEGGYGVYLIEQLMDEVIYDTSVEQGNLLDLIKYRPEEQP